MRIRLLLALAAISIFHSRSVAQTPAEWKDELVDHLSGNWRMEGQVVGRDAHHELKAEWVLNHQFLRLQEKTTANAPKAEQPYEATWFLGYDAVSERNVLHLMDVFGTRYSETLGYGVRQGNDIRFVFEYPDGPFHTTFRWHSDSGTWEWLMEQKDKGGKWTTFADFKLTRATAP